MTRKCARNARPFQSGSTDFGFTDRAGRKVGYKWQISTVVMVEHTEAELEAYRAAKGFGMGYYSLDDAHPLNFFEVWGQPTRDGVGYGPAFNRSKPIVDLDKAHTEVSKRICNARNRDAKKFAGA